VSGDLPLIRWEAPGPYEVAFSTRVGGISEGPFESLNLARMSADRHEHVIENRQRLCAAVGADPVRLTMNRQTHSATVNRAHPGRFGEPGDGLWTEDRDVPMLKLTADCVPIAIARADGGKPALALLHAGWRGLSEGVVGAGVDALGPGRLAAIVGPSIGPCCYEVGPEVAARFDADLVSETHLDLWAASERALHAAGVATVERIDLCTRCNPDLFFSHRRSGKRRGAQGVIGYVTG
jgi:YfiH family protein